MEVRNEETPAYMDDDAIIAKALSILSRRMRKTGAYFTSPSAVKDYYRVKIASLEYEVFHVAFMDVKNRIICDEQMFRGTLTSTSVYPREVVKRALQLNACAVVLAHNHPSGSTEPSEADKRITQALKDALSMLDIRVLDHIIVTTDSSYSFAEYGLI